PPATARNLGLPNRRECHRDEPTFNRSQPPGKTSAITLNPTARRTTAGGQSSALGRYVEALSIDADWRAGIIPGRPLAAHHDGLNSKTHGTPARRQRRGVAADQPTATASVEGTQVSAQPRKASRPAIDEIASLRTVSRAGQLRSPPQGKPRDQGANQ